MQGIEMKYCNACIHALVGAWRELMEASGMETLQRVSYGKEDTFGLDAIPEITISGRLKDFDQHAILITEELDDQAHRRWPTDSDPVKQPLMFFCDPTDRSIQFYKFIAERAASDPGAKIGHLLAACQPNAGAVWEKMFEAPAAITGPTTSITAVRKGEVVFSVILSYIGGIVYVVSDIGIVRFKLKDFSDSGNEKLDFDRIVQSGKPVLFPSVTEDHLSPDDCKRFVTFLGKEGYRENFNDSKLFCDDPDGYLHHKEPPGPPRPLYLSDLQSGHGAVGFIRPVPL